MANGSNTFGLKRFEAGRPLLEQLTATQLNGILDALDQLRISEGRGYRIGMRGPGGTSLDIDPGEGSGKGKTIHPFQPYAAPYTGTGEAPAEQARKIKIRPGFIKFGDGYKFPSNKALDFEVPDNKDEGEVFWLQAGVITGENVAPTLSSVAYGHGTECPPDVVSGGLPVTVYVPLFAVFTKDNSITWMEEYVFDVLQLDLAVTDVTCTGTTRIFSLKAL